MSLVIKNAIKALSDGRMLASIIWWIFLPLSILVDALLQPAVTKLYYGFRKGKQMIFFSEISRISAETYESPENAVKSLKKTAVELILLCSLSLPDALQKMIAEYFKKESGEKSAGAPKPAKKSFKAKNPKGTFLEKCLTEAAEMFEWIAKIITSGVISILSYAFYYILIFILIMVVTTVEMLFYMAKYLFTVMYTYAKSIPFIGNLLVDMPAQKSLVFVDDLLKIIDLNNLWQKQYTVEKVIKCERIETIISKYIRLWLIFISTCVVILCRALIELGRVISDTNNYTAFTMGIMGMLGCAAVYVSSFYVSEYDFSMFAYEGIIWPGFNAHSSRALLLLYVMSVAASVYSLYISITDKENEKNQMESSRAERKEFKFAVLTALIALLVFLYSGSFLNVLTAGPMIMLATVPKSLIYVMTIGAIYDIRNMFYHKHINEIKQMKNILALGLLLSCFCFMYSTLAYLPHISMALALFTYILPVPSAKMERELMPEGRGMKIKQAIYLSIRVILISALASFITLHLPTVLFRPFLYLKGSLVGIKNLLILETYAVI
ncbi:hypothetical protein NEMIN01_0971 [Nematocida minor]|uniref:uncharacterized protein n=1 Tax=Nematocida minor TaxID=1912983 RepID=UPI00222089C1|nr:uncharacterized protein NEMIN01_0971 [Nematocida minor]KAI5190272.1 hypothetical protein NEMIN01_0971 [Nematocida minor]